MTPTPNIPLLRKCVEWAEADDAATALRAVLLGEASQDFLPTGTHWFQANWSRLIRTPNEEEVTSGAVDLNTCGTAYCIAGFAIAQQPEYHAEIGLVPSCTCCASAPIEPGLKETLGGNPITDHCGLATELLGLTSHQALELFDANNSAARVRRIAEEIAGERL